MNCESSEKLIQHAALSIDIVRAINNQTYEGACQFENKSPQCHLAIADYETEEILLFVVSQIEHTYAIETRKGIVLINAYSEGLYRGAYYLIHGTGFTFIASGEIETVLLPNGERVLLAGA